MPLAVTNESVKKTGSMIDYTDTTWKECVVIPFPLSDVTMDSQDDDDEPVMNFVVEVPDDVLFELWVECDLLPGDPPEVHLDNFPSHDDEDDD